MGIPTMVRSFDGGEFDRTVAEPAGGGTEHVGESLLPATVLAMLSAIA